MASITHRDPYQWQAIARRRGYDTQTDRRVGKPGRASVTPRVGDAAERQHKPDKHHAHAPALAQVSISWALK